MINTILDLPAETLEELFSSDALYKKVRNVVGRKILYEIQTHEKNLIEHECDKEALENILGHVEKVWTEYGAKEPHWSVVTAPVFRSEVIEQNLARFYESGRIEVESLKRLLARSNVSTESLRVALEYGCGVGRVTRWLADLFSTVYGVDISRTHLAHASKYFKQQGVPNIENILISSIRDLATIPQFDFLYSKIVLQHNPPPVICAILDTLCQKLNKGGIGVVQLPTYCKGYSFRIEDYMKSIEAVNRMEMHVLPQPIVFDILARHGCQPREVSRDHLVTTMDFISTTFVFLKEKRGV